MRISQVIPIQRFVLVVCILVSFCMIFLQLVPVFADPLNPGEIKALNEWPNWVADACSGGTTADAASLSSGSGASDGAAFPNLDPTAMANGINKFIEKENPNSKLKGLGATIVASAKNAGVNPFLIVAIAHEESNLSDPSDYNVSRGNNSFGREAAPGQPSFQGAHSWYKWSSVKASVDYTAPENQGITGGGDIATYLQNQYGNSIKNSNLVDLFLQYAPPSENDTAQYVANVKGWINDMVQDTGSGPSPPSPAPSASNCSCSTGGSGPTALTGNDNQQKIFNYFVGKGLSPEQAAGIDGNFGQESRWNPSEPGGYLAQWGGSRLTALEAFAQKQGKPVTDLGVQLDYTWADLTNAPGAGGDYSHVLTNVKAAKTVEDATLQFMGTASVGGNIDGYENPGTPELQNRIDYANKILNQYGSAAGGVDSGSPCGGVVNCSGSVPGATGLSDVRQNVVCTAQQELKLWQSEPGYPHPSFAQSGYLKYSQGRPEEWCADFATWVYNQANYPVDHPDWNVAYVPDIQSIGEQNKNFHWHPASSGYTPKPGDLAIHGASHVNIFVSSSGNSATYIGGDQGDGPYPGGSIVSTETGNGYYDNGITGYVSPD
jgi:hypothetical protein